jgi:uncharacterized protein YdhG (YjbR/CyaY superfamily)
VAPSSSRTTGGEPPGLQVRSYLAALPPDTRRHMRQLRQAIRAAAPGAVDSFGYGMPAVSVNGKNVIWYAAWKRHSSLYPLTQATARALATGLKGYEISGKGTVRFPLDAPPPTALITSLVKARLAEMRGKNRQA